jgi:serine O-acetyltransferase
LKLSRILSRLNLWRDILELTRASDSVPELRSVLRTMLLDGFSILVLTRVREVARRFHIVGVNRILRLSQMALYGVEIGNEVELGHGVYFVHTLGTIIGGDSRIGDRVRFMGNNTVGTAKDNGYPVIENDVMIGCGARVLGPVHIGAGAHIGANAVVITDLPAGAVAVGIPARDIRVGAPARAKKGKKK